MYQADQLLGSKEFDNFEEDIKRVVNKYFAHLKENKKEALLENISRYIPASI